MKRTLPPHVLGFLLIGAVLALSAPTTLGQSCSFNTVPRGRVCSKEGARCGPPTVGGGDVGRCVTETPRGDALVCECQGAPTASYNMTLTPLTPGDMNTGTATSTITVIPFNGFAGKVDFACAVTGVTDPAPSCATPPAATVTGGGSATSPLAVSVSDSTAQGTYKVTVTAMDAHGRPPDNGAQSSTLSVMRSHWTIGNSLLSYGIALLAFLVVLTIWGLWRGKQASSE